MAGGILMSAVFLGSTSAFAATTTQAATGAAKLTTVISKGDAAIASRIKSLTNLSTRVNKMKYLTADQKAANAATVNDAITAMNAAKVKLDADTELAQAKLDYTAIFNDNRIYMVVTPQVAVASYANNILAGIPSVTTNLAKIQARITKAQAAGKDVTAIQAKYADVQAKLADANTQATNAITSAGTLAVDHGDKTIIASNKTINTTIKTDRSTIASDMKVARADITSMRSALKTIGF